MTKLKLLKQKVLVTGANGLLGQKVVQAFQHDFEVHGIGLQPSSELKLDHAHYSMCDITQRDELHTVVRSFKPNFIINTAAYTNVDGCEEDKEQCWKINVTGVKNLAEIAGMVRAFAVHVSTDYVFDGEDGLYTEESRPNPLGYYGRSKLASENVLIRSGIQCAILRTMVLYGAGKNLRPNFVTWLIDKLRSGENLDIVDDQYGHPTLADDLALAIRKIVELKKTGIYHTVGSEYIGRYEFALKVAKTFNLNKKLIHPIKTVDLNQKSPRPMKSNFDLSKATRDLGIKFNNVDKGLSILKEQLGK